MAPLTRKAIQSVLGSSDDTMIAEIAATGASFEELGQAWAWVNSDEALINEGPPLPSGRIAELIELLAAHDLEDEQEF
ncbi:hypothetical protein ACSVBT_17410 [Afipia sp. TerB]